MTQVAYDNADYCCKSGRYFRINMIHFNNNRQKNQSQYEAEYVGGKKTGKLHDYSHSSDRGFESNVLVKYICIYYGYYISENRR